jgi:hypothetical protein
LTGDKKVEIFAFAFVRKAKRVLKGDEGKGGTWKGFQI